VGAWGSGSFENDAAADWVVDLERARTLGPVRRALGLAAVPGGYLDVDDEGAALAAAEVVAALNGAPAADLPEPVAEWLALHPHRVGRALLDLALAAVRRVGVDSELRDLRENDPGWRAALGALEERLQGPRRAGTPREPTSGAPSTPARRARRPRPGDVVRLDLGDGSHTYGRVLVRPFLAVYDARTAQPMAPADIVARPVLFIVGAFDREVARWERVGHVPLRQGELEVPDRFIQDIPTGACRLIDLAGNERPATVEECEGRESATIWFAEHLVERIQDHYAGRPNVWVEQQRVKRRPGADGA
jgi:hypothetical protein